MKKLFVLAIGLVLTGALGTNVAALPIPDLALPGFSAVLPDPFKITFDELGNASYQINGQPAVIPLPGVVEVDASDPTGPGGQLVLVYHLPEPVVAGDILVLEPGSTNVFSDWLRFTDNTGNLGTPGNPYATDPNSTIMIFYSDVPGAGEPNEPDNLADTGPPTNIGSGNVHTIFEVGDETNNGFIYQPGAAYPTNNEYIGISDGAGAGVVPEPATVLLLASGILGLAGWRRYSSRG